jgi:vacuolar-type H+-ATPase subunit C/Vma6
LRKEGKNMDVKIKIRALTIKDENSGEEFTVTTLRSAEDIASYIEETEQDEIHHIVEAAVDKALGK